MSLKAFHILFVLAATFLCAGVGLWGLDRHYDGQGEPYFILAIIALICAALLGIYGRWYLHKTRDVPFL